MKQYSDRRIVFMERVCGRNLRSTGCDVMAVFGSLSSMERTAYGPDRSASGREHNVVALDRRPFCSVHMVDISRLCMVPVVYFKRLL